MWALLPLKRFHAAKQRLAGVLTAAERRGLFRAMVCDVLSVLQSHPEIDGVLVIGQDFEARSLANRFDAEFISESSLAVTGLNGAVHAGIQVLALRGIEQAMVLHGDMPLMTISELNRLLDMHRQSSSGRRCSVVTIAPDKYGRGTNCLICPTNAGMQFFYGSDSFAAHARSTFRAGLQLKAISQMGTSSDIDTPEDLQALLCNAGPERATGTFHYLGSTDIGARLEGRCMESAADLDEQYYRVS